MMNVKTKQVHHFEESEGKNTSLFTRREREVVDLLALGLESDAIAERLFISVNTVNNHRQRIISKAGARNTTEVLLFTKMIGMT